MGTGGEERETARGLKDVEGARVKEGHVDIRTQDGLMETFVTHPSATGPFAVIVIYMDVWGVREELFDIARRVATVGYYCMVPDFYYRQGKVRHEFRDERGRAISLERLDERAKETVRASLRQLSDDMVIDDTHALIEFVDAGEPARREMGAIGYCMGGRHVLRVAGRFPERFIASASLHGTELVTSANDSPHRELARARGELYCGFGERDRFASPATIEALRAMSQDVGVRYRYEVHRNAEHGYALPDRDVYDKHAANRDWELMFAMFHRQCSPTID
jgi:carboxymethylenebutenolidase